MKRLVPILALLPSLALAAGPERPRKQYTIEQLMKTVKLDGASFSADESRILYSSNESGIFNVYSVPIGGGKATALTKNKTDTTLAIGYFPKDDRVLYTRDHGGDENNHVYLREKDGKEKDLTPGAKLKARFGGWTHDLTGFYLLTNERDPKFFDLYRYDAQTYQRNLVYQEDLGYQFAVISNDGKWIALGKANTTSDSDIFLYDTAAKKVTPITKHTGVAAYDPQSFDPAGKYLYYLTNDGSEFKRLRRYELASGKNEDVDKADWDISYTFFSFNGKYRAQAVNEDGHTRFKVIDTATNTALELPKLPEGEVVSGEFSLSEKRMSFYYLSDRNPSNLYVYDLAAKKLTRVTDTLNKQIDPEDLVDSEVVRFKSFDGMAIPNVLYKPYQATPTAKAPALVWVHGGPGGQTRAGYSPLMQYLVNHGYVILGVNNRGSSGYGKTFFTADDRKHGREPLWDCVEAKKYLQSLPYVDPDKIAIIGGSYGGYMVLAALAFKPDEFALGVDLFGVANWVRILKSIPPYWESFRQALYAEMGDPEKDEKMLQEISPLLHADQIKRPLLVLQGANDPRVLKVESDEMVAAVKKNKVPVEYVVFPDEGHGFTKTKNEIEGYRKILAFLDKYLKKSK